MDQTILAFIIGFVGLVAGIVAGKFIFAKNTQLKVDEAESQARKIVADAQTSAETIKQQKQLEAKEKFLALRAEHDKDVQERNRKLTDTENRARQKEQSINSKSDQLEKQIKENEAIKENLNRQIEVVSLKRTELEKHQEEHIRRLEKIILHRLCGITLNPGQFVTGGRCVNYPT